MRTQASARCLIFVAALLSGPVRAGDFYSPVGLHAPTSAEAYLLGEDKCWSFTVSATQIHRFTLSESATKCSPVPARLVLYPPGALDPSAWMAQADVTPLGECLSLERRLTSGTYKICAGLLQPPGKLSVQLVTSPAPSTPSNDRCATPMVLTGSGGTLSNETLASSNHDYSPLPRGVCAAATRTKGGDRVWAVDLANAKTIDVTVNASVGDVTVYVLSDCGRWWNACVAASAHVKPAGAVDQTERVIYTNNTGATRRYFIVVDTPWQTSPTFNFVWTVN